MTTKAEKFKEFYKKKFEERVDSYRSGGKIVFTRDLNMFMSKMAAFINKEEHTSMELHFDRQLFIFDDSSALIFIIEGNKYGFFATTVKRLEEITDDILKKHKGKYEIN